MTEEYSMLTVKRPIVIDGANVAWNFGKWQKFACRGILLAAHYFQQRNHHVTAIVPFKYQVLLMKGELEQGEILQQLHYGNILSFAPCNSSDDDFVIQRALQTDGIIVSNDKYEDRLTYHPEWGSIIEERLLSYSFVAGDDFIPNPSPLGEGQTLEKFLQYDDYQMDNDLVLKRKSNEEILNDILGSNSNVDNMYMFANLQLETTVPAEQLSSNQNCLYQRAQDDILINQKQTFNGALADNESNNTKTFYRNNESTKSKRTLDTTQKQAANELFESLLTVKPDNGTFSQKTSNQTGKPFKRDNGQNLVDFNFINCTSSPSTVDAVSTVSSSNRSQQCNNQICGFGTVTKISVKSAFVESDYEKLKIFFPRSAHGEFRVHRMNDFFKIGDRFAFVAIQQKSRNGCTYKATKFCLEKDLLIGYAVVNFVDLTSGNLSAKGVSVNKIQSNIFFHQTSYGQLKLSANVPLNRILHVGAWVKFRALPQPLDNDASWVAVAVNDAIAVGIVVKVCAKFGYVWSRMLGAVYFSPDCFESEPFFAGDWIEFRFREQTEKNFCRWKTIGSKKLNRAVMRTRTINNKITVAGFGFVGVIQDTMTTIWTEEIGRICVNDPDIIRKCQYMKFNKLQTVRFEATYLRKFSLDVDTAWLVTDLELPTSDSSPIPKHLTSIRHGVEAVVEKILFSKRCGFMKTKQTGESIYFRSIDTDEDFNNLKVGDCVIALIVVQEIDNECWRAFFFIREEHSSSINSYDADVEDLIEFE